MCGLSGRVALEVVFLRDACRSQASEESQLGNSPASGTFVKQAPTVVGAGTGWCSRSVQAHRVHVSMCYSSAPTCTNLFLLIDIYMTVCVGARVGTCRRSAGGRVRIGWFVGAGWCAPMCSTSYEIFGLVRLVQVCGPKHAFVPIGVLVLQTSV